MKSRRAFLKTAAATGIAGIVAARRAPAVAQTIRLHLLFRVDFLPQGEAELKRQLAEYGKQMKMDVALETINENDLQIPGGLHSPGRGRAQAPARGVRQADEDGRGARDHQRERPADA